MLLSWSSAFHDHHTAPQRWAAWTLRMFGPYCLWAVHLLILVMPGPFSWGFLARAGRIFLVQGALNLHFFHQIFWHSNSSPQRLINFLCAVLKKILNLKTVEWGSSLSQTQVGIITFFCLKSFLMKTSPVRVLPTGQPGPASSGNTVAPGSWEFLTPLWSHLSISTKVELKKYKIKEKGCWIWGDQLL